MIAALLLPFVQLGDRRFLGVVLKALGITVLLFAVAGLLVAWMIDRWVRASALTGRLGGEWFGGPLAVVLLVVAVWLLFRTAATAVIGLFGDEVAAGVEARFYPAAAARARRVPAAEAVRATLGAAIRTAAVNAVLLPVYAALLLTGVGAPILFLVVNAWLLGRDLGDAAAARHLDPAAVRAWRAATRGRRFVVGLATGGLFVVPVLGLMAPALGAAMATHLFHRSRA